MPRLKPTDMANIDNFRPRLSPGSGERDDLSIRPIADALLSAIADSGRNPCGLARNTGLDNGTIRRFVGRKGGLMLASADKIASDVGVRMVHEGKVPESDAGDDNQPLSLSDELRSAIADCGLSAYTLARKSGVNNQRICNFVRREGDLKLASADKIASVLPVKMIRVAKATGLEVANEPPLQPITDALRSAITDSGRSLFSLTKGSGVEFRAISSFIHQEGVLKLASADKIASDVGVRMVHEGKVPGSNAGDDNQPLSLSDGLRSAIADCGLSTYAMAKLSRISTATIRRFRDGCDNITPVTFNNLANTLGLKPLIVEAEGPSPVLPALTTVRSVSGPTRRCPIELRGEGFPPLVYGCEVPRLTGIAYALTKFAVERFLEGGVCMGSELAERTTSTSDRPIRLLTLKLKEAGFEPLSRVLIWEPKKGGTLRIIDPGPK